jgi:hypothetical protein
MPATSHAYLQVPNALRTDHKLLQAATSKNPLDIKVGGRPVWPEKTQIHVGAIVLSALCFFVPSKVAVKYCKRGKGHSKEPVLALEHHVIQQRRKGGQLF